MRKAKDEGKVAFRSAGSHSPVDVCIIDWKEKKIRLVQSKGDSMTEKTKQKLEKKFDYLNGSFEVEYIVK